MLKQINTRTVSITPRDGDSIMRYFNEVNKIKVFETPEDEYACAMKAYNGDEKAKEEMVLRNLNFVVSVAKQYAAPMTPFEDLINEGNLALIKAVDKFDPTQGFKFISYAVWWVRQRMTEYYATKGRQVKLPIGDVWKITKIKDKMDRICQERQVGYNNINMEDVFDDTMSGKSANDRGVNILNEIRGGMVKPLDTPVGKDDDGGNRTLEDVIENTFVKPTDHMVIKNSANEMLSDMLKELRPMERNILIGFFGLNNTIKLSVADMGKNYNCSPETIRKRKDKVIKKLGEALKSRGLGFNDLMFG
jgi:RNA polymerase primary sigma factor